MISIVRKPPIAHLGPYLALVLLGFAIVAAGASGVDPRSGRRARLVDLIQVEDEHARALRLRVDALQADLLALEASAGTGAIEIARTSIDVLAPLAGTAPVSGPGIRVELRDSTLRESPNGDPNDLVIHEQDLQAVVNALWGSGAEAIAINGERITSASAVRCVGNTLLLHGVVYAPPYRIAAIGDAKQLASGVEADPLVERFRIFAEEMKLTFAVTSDPTISLPGRRFATV